MRKETRMLKVEAFSRLFLMSRKQRDFTTPRKEWDESVHCILFLSCCSILLINPEKGVREGKEEEWTILIQRKRSRSLMYLISLFFKVRTRLGINNNEQTTKAEHETLDLECESSFFLMTIWTDLSQDDGKISQFCDASLSLWCPRDTRIVREVVVKKQ
jgi:hypothetical protein